MTSIYSSRFTVFTILLAAFSAGIAPAATLPQLVAQEGHRLPVNSIAYSPDGELLATAGQDDVVRIWQSSTGLLLRALVSHHDPINALAFRPDGAALASADEHGGIRIWDVHSGQLTDSKAVDAGSISSIAYSPDGKSLAFGTGDGFRIVTPGSWDDTRFYPVSRAVTCLAFSPDGRFVASGGKDRAVRIWDRDTGEQTLVLQVSDGAINSVSYSPDGRELVSTGSDDAVRVWDTSSGAAVGAFTGHTDETTAASFASDGATIASASLDGTVKIWRVGSSSELRTIDVSEQGLASLAWRPDSVFVSVAGADGAVRTYDSTTGRSQADIAARPAAAYVDALSPDGHTIAMADGRNGIMIWSAGQAGKLRQLPVHTEAVTCLAFSPNGTLLASGGDDRLVRIWQVATGNEVTTLRGHRGTINSLAFSPDGEILASGANDGTIMLWDVVAGVEMTTFSGSITHTSFAEISLPPIQEARSLMFSPDSSLLASACDDAAILWNTVTGDQFATWVQNAPDVNAVALSPDGQELATANSSGEIDIARVANRQVLGKETNGPVNVGSLSFSTDGRRVAAASADGIINVLGSDGSILHTIAVSDPFGKVQFHSATGKLIAATTTGDLYLWDSASYNPVATMIVSDSGDWAAMDAQGRFDGAKAGLDKLHWVIGDSAFPLAAIGNGARTPDLFMQALTEAAPDATSIVLPAAFHSPPAVTILKMSHEQRAGQPLAFTAAATDRGGGVEDLRVIRNGILLADDIVPEVQTHNHGKVAFKSYSIPLLPGKNIFKVTAFDYEGTECASPATVEVDAK